MIYKFENAEMKNNKKLFLIIGIVCLLLALAVGIFLVKRNGNLTKDVNDADSLNESVADETLDDESEEAEVEHNLRLTIIGPEEDIILKGQARGYKALAEGNGKWSTLVDCNWKFYLNENNEEVLYQEMDNRSLLSGVSKEVCGFTSTFMDKIGKLRVVLTMTIYNSVDDNLETVTAEREYIVQK